VREAIGAADFRYERLTPTERDAVIHGVRDRLESGELSRVGEHRQDVWNTGWSENLEAFATSGFALESLVPRFIKTGPIVRLDQDYVRRIDPAFEFRFHDVIRRWLYLEYMADVSRIVEFGSGSAYNLVAISELAPDTTLVGLDWAESAVALTNAIGEKRGLSLTGRRFDFFHPDHTVMLGPGTAALTISALEQIGPRHEPFFEFVLAQRPQICVHMEPVLELYDAANEADALAIQYHTTRGYLNGFLPRLRALEAEGRAEVLQSRRLRFGSLYHEAYSVIVWRPH
jgi:hypothetical protein